MIWGNAPKNFKDQVTLQIIRHYLSSDTNILPSQEIITPERLKIDYSINGLDSTIQLSGDSVPAVTLPPKPRGKAQSKGQAQE